MSVRLKTPQGCEGRGIPSWCERVLQIFTTSIVGQTILSSRDFGPCACCHVILFRWGSRESILFPHDIRRRRHEDPSQECGSEKP